MSANGLIVPDIDFRMTVPPYHVTFLELVCGTIEVGFGETGLAHWVVHTGRVERRVTQILDITLRQRVVDETGTVNIRVKLSFRLAIADFAILSHFLGLGYVLVYETVPTVRTALGRGLLAPVGANGHHGCIGHGTHTGHADRYHHVEEE